MDSLYESQLLGSKRGGAATGVDGVDTIEEIRKCIHLEITKVKSKNNIKISTKWTWYYLPCLYELLRVKP